MLISYNTMILSNSNRAEEQAVEVGVGAAADVDDGRGPGQDIEHKESTTNTLIISYFLLFILMLLL